MSGELNILSPHSTSQYDLTGIRSETASHPVTDRPDSENAP
jgi:hypothetical protein